MILLKEIWYRRWNFFLGSLGMAVAVTGVVFFVIMTRASQNETRILTRNMGFNLRIIPDSTNMNEFWTRGYSSRTMPEKYVQVLVDKKAIYYAHLTATLHQRIRWRGMDVMLTGISPDELNPKGKKRSKMIFAIPRGKVYVGYEIARAANVHSGDTLTILGKRYVVERTLAETGSEDDVRIYFDLNDLQNLLHKEGLISEIMALNCMCSAQGDDPLGDLRRQLETDLPDARVIMNRTIAVAREKQRKMMDNYFAVLLPVLLLIAAIWTGALAMINVMQRSREIGILRALGFRGSRITGIFFARAVLLGLAGAGMGYFLGTWLAMKHGPQVFRVTAKAIHPLHELLIWAMCLAPFFAVVASAIPVVLAVYKQPGELLKEE